MRCMNSVPIGCRVPANWRAAAWICWQPVRRLLRRASSELFDELVRRCDRLIAARPSMAPIHNLLTAWKSS